MTYVTKSERELIGLHKFFRSKPFIIVLLSVIALIAVFAVFFLPDKFYLNQGKQTITGNYVLLGMIEQEQTELGYKLIVFRISDYKTFNTGNGFAELLLEWTGNGFDDASGFIENSRIIPASPKDLDYFLPSNTRVSSTSSVLNRKNPYNYQDPRTRPGLPLRGPSYNTNIYLGNGTTTVKQLSMVYDDKTILITAYEANDYKSAEINLRYQISGTEGKLQITDVSYFYRPVISLDLQKIFRHS